MHSKCGKIDTSRFDHTSNAATYMIAIYISLLHDTRKILQVINPLPVSKNTWEIFANHFFAVHCFHDKGATIITLSSLYTHHNISLHTFQIIR